MSEENECKESAPAQEMPMWLKVVGFPFFLVWWIVKAILKFFWNECVVKIFKETTIYKMFFRD